MQFSQAWSGACIPLETAGPIQMTGTSLTVMHPMAREVLRVLMVMHQRTCPDLLEMAKRTGLAD
ncbi:hypothetical protein [Streptomyces benahoarensis]|uniref:Uncharacterized protein n=1 Tax=Streptomyces benahoarensis TaxID=2595054 RepID=A0A553Z778_9ACTN|nr:hypothetical protein [Streptomyces benahoarensis]TSB19295.1 hypothetical protein FNJ62_22720 [Streptomyces benahoarensis]TSB37283.1 hypothetical protein FNZ23_18655 [Streptomyces benahoarensis]